MKKFFWLLAPLFFLAALFLDHPVMTLAADTAIPDINGTGFDITMQTLAVNTTASPGTPDMYKMRMAACEITNATGSTAKSVSFLVKYAPGGGFYGFKGNDLSNIMNGSALGGIIFPYPMLIDSIAWTCTGCGASNTVSATCRAIQ